MPSARSKSLATGFVGSAAFFIVTMTQVFVFHSVPKLDDWVQIAGVPVIAMVLQRIFGFGLDEYFHETLQRGSRALLGLFVLDWVLFFIPICVITFFGA